MIYKWAVALVLWASALGAQSAAMGQYNEANAHYRAGDFTKARQVYLKAVSTDVADARLFYNLGNACFKSGLLGEAILWYERAGRLAPDDEDIEANLRFANLVKKDREPSGESNVLQRFVTAAYAWPSLDHLSLFFALAFLALFILGVQRLLRGAGLGALWLAGVVVCVGMSGIFAGWLGTRLYGDSGNSEAIVIVGEVMARSGPDEGQTEVFTAHEGTKVRLVRQEGEWILVRLANGLGGWIQTEAVARI